MTDGEAAKRSKRSDPTRVRTRVGGQIEADGGRESSRMFAVTALVSLPKRAPEQVGSAKRWRRRVIAELKAQKQGCRTDFFALLEMSTSDPLRTCDALFILSLMARRLLMLLPSLVFAATSGSLHAAQGASKAAPGISLQRAIERGKTMYLYDRAAWLTSDDVIARLPSERAREIGGWVVSPSVNGVQVFYFGKDGNADRAIYAAQVNGETVTNATIYPVKAEPLLKEPALQMARALRAARIEMGRHSDWRPCTDAPFNTIVLPPERDGTVPVYFLTPQTQTGSFPFGGHYEIDISAAGSATYSRAFTRSCITMSEPPRSDGATPAGLFVTHLLDPNPTEIHVFEQYYVRVPVFVGTGPKSVWKVEDGRVDDVSAMMAK